MKFIRADIGVAYAFTAVFAISVMVIANQAFHVAGVKISDAQAVTKMAQTLGSIVGPAGFWVYSIGFWSAVFASLLGVWQSVPYLFADYWGLLRKYSRDAQAQVTKTTSTPYRIALLYITLAPLPFAFMNQPLFIIRAYTIIGSLFIPFLGATLLYMNNRFTTDSGVPRNGRLNNALLALSLFDFRHRRVQRNTRALLIDRMALSDIFSNLQILIRWSHVLVGILWLGNLYVLNFVIAPLRSHFRRAT